MGDSTDIRQLIHSSARCTPYDMSGIKYPTAGLRGDVPRLNANAMTPDRFWEMYVRTNKPVIIEGAAQSLFDNANDIAWTVDGLKKNLYADVKLPVKQNHVRLVGPEDGRLN